MVITSDPEHRYFSCVYEQEQDNKMKKKEKGPIPSPIVLKKRRGVIMKSPRHTSGGPGQRPGPYMHANPSRIVAERRKKKDAGSSRNAWTFVGVWWMVMVAVHMQPLWEKVKWTQRPETHVIKARVTTGRGHVDAWLALWRRHVVCGMYTSHEGPAVPQDPGVYYYTIRYSV